MNHILLRKGGNESAEGAKAARTFGPGPLAPVRSADGNEHQTDAIARSVISGGVARRHWSFSNMRLAARIHTDDHAATSARTRNSAAYTTGKDIFFGEDRFDPSTTAGRRLLAHELTHVVQGANASFQSSDECTPVDELEREARQVAAAVVVGSSPPPIYGIAQPSVYPLKDPPDSPNPPSGPSFGNLFQDQPAKGSSLKVVELKLVDGVWYADSPRAPRTRAAGTYDFVVQDGRILAVKASGEFGHTEAASGGRVSYAGQVEFGGPGGKRGAVTRWSNASGHYAPVAAFSENAIKAGMPADRFVPYRGPKGEMGPQLPVLQPGSQGGATKTPAAAGGAKTGGSVSPQTPDPGVEGAQGSAVRSGVPSEERVEGGRTRRVGSSLGAGEPGFTRSLGFAALKFGAGVATSFLQGAMRDKILSDLSKLPQPRVDRRGASEFLRDPATGPAIRLLDAVSKDLKPFSTGFPTQHQEIMATAEFKLLAIALLPGKTTADYEKRFAQLDPLSDEMAAYDEQLSVIQDNLDALLSLESKAKQTKAAADQLIAKLPDLFTAQGVASQFGAGPIPDVEDFAKIDSNLRFLSVSIGIAFADAHSAKVLIDRAVAEVSQFRADLKKIWWTEFASQLKELASTGQASAATATPAAKPPRPPAQAHPTPPGVRLPSIPQGFPSIEEQTGKGRCPTCHDRPGEKEASRIPEEFKKPMTDEQLKEWFKQTGF